jgi:VanZ family protein
MNRTSARPLALVYVAVVVYASLYPFSDWRDQGIAPWAFLLTAMSRYWTTFDIVANVLGYFPLGVLLALSVLRGGQAGRTRMQALATAVLLGGALSMLLESAQSYLPERVPSNLDFALNLLGTFLGASLACGLDHLGLTGRWSQFRDRWFLPDSHGALVLLALWPVALLFPAAVPMGLGRVLERLESALADWLQDTPFLNWIPVREVELQPLVPGVEMLCVALGLLAPCLLVYCVVAPVLRRVALALMLAATGIAASALSAALSYGPTHAWAWLNLPAQAGLALSLAASLMLAAVPVRLCRALLLILLTMHLALVNQAPESAYFAQTLQAWEQGQFIRFHGLAQWLGWLWPFASMGYLLGRVWRRDRLESTTFPRNG